MALPPIIPPDPIEANVDYRYDGCYQSMVLVLLQRLVDESRDPAVTDKLQEIIDELTELNGKVATETTLEAARVLLDSLNSKDFATETTLAAIKAQTDLLNFTGAKLRTTGEDASGGGGVSVFGDTGGYASLVPNGLDQLVLAADTDFKEVILYHENKRRGWVKFGGGVAVVGEGFPIESEQTIFLDRCRDEIRIIFESGFDAKELQINTVKL